MSTLWRSSFSFDLRKMEAKEARGIAKFGFLRFQSSRVACVGNAPGP